MMALTMKDAAQAVHIDQNGLKSIQDGQLRATKFLQVDLGEFACWRQATSE
jgi:hypothetical protein